MADIGGLICDSFAGGGGASEGLRMALGRDPDIAINHDEAALAMHAANHPATRHLSQNVWQVDPLEEVGTAPVAVAWFSPDCKHFSKAKGGKPVARNIRDLAWVVVLWAKRVKPSVIHLENVEEFKTWGPLMRVERDGQMIELPDPEKRGDTFVQWLHQLRKLGYTVEWRALRACDYGAPTIRKRFHLIARCDGEPIVWPEPTHGAPDDPAVIAGAKKPWRTAASIIDWSIPCPSIFLTKDEGRALGVKRPLADKTLWRIFKGIDRYLVKAVKPFIVNLTHHGGERIEDVDDPLRTVTGAHRGEKAIVSPTIVRTAHGDVDKNGKRRGQGQHDPAAPLHTVTSSPDYALAAAAVVRVDQTSAYKRNGVAHPDEPLRTLHSVNPFGLVSAHIAKFRGDSAGADMNAPLSTVTANSYIKRPGGAPPQGVIAAYLAQHNTSRGAPHAGHDARDPLSTVTASGAQQGVVSAFLANLKGSERRMSDIEAPVPAITAQGWHVAEVRAFLTKYYGNEQDGVALDEPLHTVTSKDRFGLVVVEGQEYQIVDIGMRMLSPRELFRAQGFRDDYVIEKGLFRLDDGAHEWRKLTKTQQIRMCGNSVCPPVAAALVKANLPKALRARHAVMADDGLFGVAAA